MRKALFLGLVMLLALVFPTLAQAQATITFDSLAVQLWPEFDQPKMLVLYDFRLSPDVTLPATVSLRIPAGADLTAVAQDVNGGLVTVDSKTATDGDWLVVTLDVTANSTYRIEYYMPLDVTGRQRSYAFSWPGDYSVKAFSVLLQQPVDAAEMKTTPELKNTGVGDFNLAYFSSGTVEMPAGKNYLLELSYNKSSDTLSASSVNVQQPGDTTGTQPASGQNTVSTYLPWILGGLGLALIVGGGLWYWQTGKSSESPRSRRRHARQMDDDDEEDDDGQVYCPQCGKRAKPGDRFCRACGSKIRARG